MYESEMKSAFVKIANLEVEVRSAQSEKSKIEMEFNLFKEKSDSELKVFCLFKISSYRNYSQLEPGPLTKNFRYTTWNKLLK